MMKFHINGSASQQAYVWGYSQVGKATDFDSVMRRFESCYPCQGQRLGRHRSAVSGGRYAYLTYGPLAQSVEHLTFNQVVPGSIPGWFTRAKGLYQN